MDRANGAVTGWSPFSFLADEKIHILAARNTLQRIAASESAACPAAQRALSAVEEVIDILAVVVALSQRVRIDKTHLEDLRDELSWSTHQDKPVPLERLELSVRAYNALVAAGVRNTGDLTKMTEYEVLKIPNLGRTSLYDIKEALASLGLSLK